MPLPSLTSVLSRLAQALLTIPGRGYRLASRALLAYGSGQAVAILPSPSDLRKNEICTCRLLSSMIRPGQTRPLALAAADRERAVANVGTAERVAHRDERTAA
jgi:hypothetical protein